MILFLLALLAQPLAQDTRANSNFADFDKRVSDYWKIHQDAEETLGGLAPTRSSSRLEKKRKALADAIRSRRVQVAQGGLFTAEIAAEFRKVIAAGMQRRSHHIRESLRSGEQAVARLQVNGSYPEGVPLETMPPTILASLPNLPSELDYRFVGSTLVVRDVTANLIVDLLPNAITLK